MKISLIILHADPARGGAERYTIDLAAALVKRGHFVTVIASSFASPVEGVHFHALHSAAPTRARRYLQFLDSLDAHLNETDYDIVHAMLPVRRCDVYHPHAGIAADALASGHLKHSGLIQRRIAQVSTRFNKRRQLFGAVEEDLLTSSHPPVVLCLSDYVKATVRKFFPALPDDRLHKLFNAVDLDRFDPARDPEAGLQVRQKFNLRDDDVTGLMLAQDFHRKGLKESIIALADVSNLRLKLLVAGKDNPAPYRRLARSLGLEQHVIFAGVTDDPYGFYRAADFLFLPTWHDPCSLVVLEAVAMGVPVISTALNGACEIISNNVQGYVIADPAQRSKLADALKTMTNDETRSRLSLACLLLRPTLAYGKHLDALEGIYNACYRPSNRKLPLDR